MKAFHVVMALANIGLAAVCHEKAKNAATVTRQRELIKTRNVGIACATVGMLIASVTKSN